MGVVTHEVERCVEGVGERNLAESGADIGRVTRLDGQDGTSSSQVILVHDGRSSSEVGGYTDTLEHARESDE